MTCQGLTDVPGPIDENADDPNRPPEMGWNPDVGDDDLRMPMWLPHVFPVVYT